MPEPRVVCQPARGVPRYREIANSLQSSAAVRADPAGFARIQWDTWSPLGWFDDACRSDPAGLPEAAVSGERDPGLPGNRDLLDLSCLCHSGPIQEVQDRD